MDYSEIQTMKQRLERLERSSRWVQVGCALLLVCVTALVSMGAQKFAKRTLEASEFIVRDSEGNIRARLFSDNTGPHLALYRVSGDVASLLESDEIVVSGVNGKHGVKLSAAADSAEVLVIGSDQAIHATEDSDGIHLLVTGKSELGHFLLSIDKDGPSLELVDGHGFATHVGVTETKTPRTGEAHKSSAASLVMFGEGGKVIWSAP